MTAFIGDVEPCHVLNVFQVTYLPTNLANMLPNETATHQAEHFEWMNAIKFYQSYLDIIEDRLESITMISPEKTEGIKLEALLERLGELKLSMVELTERVSSHLEEVELAPATENRLDLDLQALHHIWLRDKFDEFESRLNEFRTGFNEFYLKTI